MFVHNVPELVIIRMTDTNIFMIKLITHLYLSNTDEYIYYSFNILFLLLWDL